MTILEEAFEAALETNSEEDREQMQRHAEAKKSTQMPGVHESTIEFDSEKLDTITNALCDIVYTLVDAEDVNGMMVVDPTLEYSVKGMCYSFLSQANYLIKKCDSAIPKLLNKVRYLERQFDGTEIADVQLTEAMNNVLDTQKQMDNYRKHLLPAAEATWDRIVGEPRSTGNGNDRTDNVTTMAQLEARRLLSQFDRKS